MTKLYGPFDAGLGAGWTEANWSQMARYLLTSGVIPQSQGLPVLDGNPLQVFGDSSGMQVKVRSGASWILGHLYQNDVQETLAIAASNGTNPRIDRIIIRLNWTTNVIDTAVLTGTPAVTPVAPALTQSATVWEISLAQVLVGAAVITIAAGSVTDERSYAGSVDNPVLAKVDLTGAAVASIDVASLSQAFRTLEVYLRLRGDTAAVSTSLRARFNADGGNNYDTQLAAFVGTSATVSQTFAASSINCGPVPANTALANMFSTHVLKLIGYGDAQNKVLLANTAYKHNVTTGTMETDQAAGHWRNNGAITQVSLFPLAGNFAIGSFLEFYGKVK